MPLSELIRMLQSWIDEEGDLRVCVAVEKEDDVYSMRRIDRTQLFTGRRINGTHSEIVIVVR